MTVIELHVTRDEALWLKSAARRAAEDTEGVPQAKDALFKLAKKIGRAIDQPRGAVADVERLRRAMDQAHDLCEVRASEDASRVLYEALYPKRGQ